jgi:hypothetical protein
MKRQCIDGYYWIVYGKNGYEKQSMNRGMAYYDRPTDVVHDSTDHFAIKCTKHNKVVDPVQVLSDFDQNAIVFLGICPECQEELEAKGHWIDDDAEDKPYTHETRILLERKGNERHYSDMEKITNVETTGLYHPRNAHVGLD